MYRKNLKLASKNDMLFHLLAIENRKHISEELFDKLCDAILAGTLPSGYVFPNENDLCQKLNIGRSSLRETYASLEALGLISRTKSGTYVNAKSKIHNAMNFEAIAQRTNTHSLAEYRKIVEVGVAQSAAKKATEEDVEHINTILEEMERAEDDPAALSQLDFDFHSYLVRITGNELLIISFNTIRSIYEDFTEPLFAEGYFHSSLADHRDIVQALRSHDPVTAGSLMGRHLNHVEQFYSGGRACPQAMSKGVF